MLVLTGRADAQAQDKTENRRKGERTRESEPANQSRSPFLTIFFTKNEKSPANFGELRGKSFD